MDPHQISYQRPHERTQKHRLGGIVATAPAFFPSQMPPPPQQQQQKKKQHQHSQSKPTIAAAAAGVVGGDGGDVSPSSSSPVVLSAPITTEKSKLKIQRRIALTELMTNLTQRLEAKTYDCMICMSAVIRNEDIWSCTNCWAIFHHKCIQKWHSSQVSVAPEEAGLPPLPTQSEIRNADPITAALYLSQQTMYRVAERELGTTKKLHWKCPGCRQELTTPPKPSCFCGKVEHPWQLPDAAFHDPHSCGAPCGRMREGTSCPHPCTLVCHPGTCPPCSAMGPMRKCFCGKREYRLRCGVEDEGSTCGEPCGKPLSCGHHSCEEICHKGPCKACTVKVIQRCYCGTHEESRICGSGKEWIAAVAVADGVNDSRFFSCGEMCRHDLSCGKHKCPQPCHQGACGDCALLPKHVKTCPCGKTPIETLQSKPRTSCIDPIPTCNQICGKRLPCGHNCESKCHIGSCPICIKPVQKPCRCGSTTTTLPCNEATSSKVLLCGKVCKMRKSCMRHFCENVCCPGPKSKKQPDPDGIHICMLVCGNPLNCGIHTCDQLCHPGTCRQCRVMLSEPISCRCGSTVILPPVACGTAPPVCPHQCILPRPCGHRDPPGFTHKCHFGECPPCVAVVDKMCAGGHEMRRSVSCSRVISCGRPCGKPLPCGHICRVPCHAGSCPTYQPNPFASGKIPPDDYHGCGQPCGKKRECCAHLCKEPCHPRQPCPPTVCREKITIHCHCGRRSSQVECLASSDLPAAATTGGGDEIHELPCDDDCLVLQHSRALAQAFGVRPEGDEAPEYSEYLLEVAAGHKRWVIELEKTLGSFVKSDSKTLVMKPMDAPSREFIHKISKYYGLTAVSEGREPARYIVLSKTSEVRIPSKLLSVTVDENPILSQRIASSSPTSSSTTSSESISGPTKQTKYNSDGEESYTVRISDKVNLDVSLITNILRPFAWQCQLITLDKKNALAVFQTSGAMRAACKLLLPLGLTVTGSE